MNFDLLREVMVKEQIIKRGISDKRVIEAFNKVSRHKFVPADELENSYSDFPLPIECNQTISQPYIVAIMTEKLGLTGKEKVLEIGTGSGYQTAILAELAKEVYTVEKIPILSKNAQILLEESGYRNIYFKIGDGSLGWEEKAPFDRIIVTAYCPEIPNPLAVQLSENGKIILPLGGVFSQTLTLAEKINNKLDRRDICACVFVPLIGEYGAKLR
ncbi:MAG: protein-L-isoaspartate(D-aspartate) O-methyltransferase [Candidatus Omnitrophota bacterium]